VEKEEAWGRGGGGRLGTQALRQLLNSMSWEDQ